MCIIILNQKTTLTKKVLNQSWESNPHGAGLMYVDSGKVEIFKSFDKSEYIKKYFEIRQMVRSEIVLHFRIATSGLHNEENLHPFRISDKLAFVHNGIISNLGNKLHSDTYQLNEILKDTINGNKLTEGIKSLLTLICEDYSKLVFLDSQNNITIINENLGHWDSLGNWYSNCSYKPYKKPKYTYKPYKWDEYKTSKKSDSSVLQEICPSCSIQSNFNDFQYSIDFNEWICPECIEEIRIANYDL